MARTLISPDNSLLRNVAGCAFAIILIPVAIVAKLVITPFEKPIERSPDDVLALLRRFQDGTADDYDWDDFIGIPISDVELEALRAEAALLNLPFRSEDLDRLHSMIARAEAIVEKRRAT
ncbi:hypothetical protein [Sandarakinorhabdus oryzae]|uniref:hypothetical protein n=1 Tax=Sandarakinorhabdus oryzae TaxID=2675220 RepID=UPI0012E19451|nr:hypothetical protein [Sandarakinorhabdus oryzae]